MLEHPDPDLMRILEIVNAGDITSVQVRVGDTEIFVSRLDEHAGGRAECDGPAASASQAPGRPPAAAPEARPAPPEVPGAAGPAPAPLPAAAEADGRITVNAPMVGLFYRAPEPGADPYVDVDTEVAEETTVGLIEAMKVYTAIPAGVQGTIEEVLVANAQFVEFDQPLFTVVPADGQGDG